MIRFQDMAEKKESPELLSPAEYQGIKPCERLSKEDAIGFWNGMFATGSEVQDVYTIDEEYLLSEIFDRYENEFVFDFELDDEIQLLLSCFDPAQWETLSDAEKKSAIYELATAIGERIGLDKAPEIRFYDGEEGSYGAYLPSENTIELNQNLLADAKEMVDTVAHEIRHAYQHQRAKCQETMQDKLYQLNFENYISPIPLGDGKYLLFTDYQNQLVEAEARAFANIFTNKEAAQ